MSDIKKDKKLYKLKLSEDEITMIWLTSNIISGKGPYKEFFDDIKIKLKPYINKKITMESLSRYISGDICFTGERLKPYR